MKAGKKGTPWTGVRAHPAKLNLSKMAKGDKAFFYHTGDERQIVGIVEIGKTAYPDPTAEKDLPWVVVDTVAVEPLKTPVTLGADQGGCEAEGDGAGEARPSLRPARDGCGVEAHLQAGRRQSLAIRRSNRREMETGS